MKLRVDFKESVRTPIGSYRYAIGEFDPQSGILWLSAGEARGEQRPMKTFAHPDAVRGGIHLASKSYVEELMVVVKAAPAPKPDNNPQRKAA